MSRKRQAEPAELHCICCGLCSCCAAIPLEELERRLQLTPATGIFVPARSAVSA